MKRKLLPVISLGMLGALGLATSFSANATSGYYNGFFGGVSAGVSDTFSKVKTDSSVQFQDNAGNAYSHTLFDLPRINHIDPSFNINFGYGTTFNQLYLGVETGGGFTKSKVTLNPSTNFRSGNAPAFDVTLNSNQKAKLRSVELTLDLTPGVLLCDKSLVFGRVGLSVNQTKFESATTFSYIDTVPNRNSAFTSTSSKKNRLGFRLGLGISNYLTENLVLNANYIYTQYKKINNVSGANVSGVGAGAAVPAGLQSANSVFMKRQSFLIGLQYYFY